LKTGDLVGVRKGKRVYILASELDSWASRKGLHTDDAVTARELLGAAREVLREAKRQRVEAKGDNVCLR
jgi:hypothetical protein